MQTSKRRNRFIAILLVMAFICSLWGRKGLGFVSADEEVATATDATEAGADSGSGALTGGTVATTTDAKAGEPEEGEILDFSEEDNDASILDSELELNFVVVSGDRFDTPSYDNYIALDLGEEGTTFDSATLTIVNEFTGVATDLAASNIVGSSMLFMMNFEDDYY